MALLCALTPSTHTRTPPLPLLQYPNEGMPQHNFPSQHGSLHIKFIVDLPHSISKEQREALDKVLSRP